MINAKTDKDVEPVSSLTKNVTLKNDMYLSSQHQIAY